ncbi:MAG: 50S ribosomal protein L30 [Candidatus Stahlbacteria bacterium]|jgi:large subunit ribosomal protein L30|nr:50S ribosomal protein L30 [candidate division WOR-3 bacterium]MCK4756026.1 50S ribosomal protein L30 [candidate division WOR-3 bacterium]NOR18043.1 50S ribosomal protein L30 [candidate division WOR-3 bacterium]TET61866.1 MAG: 50S ribosomal protein L30 [Candidatus Stahlbacteria bacterium]
MKKIKVILKKSPINKIRKHKLTLKALGLTKIGKSRILPDNDAVRGMINKVSYMLEVKEINDEVK